MKKSLRTVGLSLMIMSVLFCTVRLSADIDFVKKIKQMQNSQEMLPDTRVKIGSDITVSENQDLNGDVICILGNINVNGRIRGTLVSILGEIKAGDKARVDGDTVLIFSKMSRQFNPGKSVIEINILRDFFIKASRLFLKTFVFNLILSILLFIILVWLFISRILPKLDFETMRQQMTKSPGKLFLFGLLGWVIVYATSCIFLLSIIGSGLSVLTAGAAGLLWITGWIVIVLYLGTGISDLLKAKLSGFVKFLIGLVAFIVISIIPVIGQLTVLVLGTIGFGTVLDRVFAKK